MGVVLDGHSHSLLADNNPEIVQRMTKDLEAWIASVNRSKEGADYRK
jgi:hypothetical protein